MVKEFKMTLEAISDTVTKLPGEKLLQGNGFVLAAQKGIERDNGAIRSIGELIYVAQHSKALPGVTVKIEPGQRPTEYRAIVSNYDNLREKDVYENVCHMIAGRNSGYHVRY